MLHVQSQAWISNNVWRSIYFTVPWFEVREWLLFNANSAICHLFHGGLRCTFSWYWCNCFASFHNRNLSSPIIFLMLLVIKVLCTSKFCTTPDCSLNCSSSWSCSLMIMACFNAKRTFSVLSSMHFYIKI